ncbi:MAG: hypothetical protein E5V28_14410 [Mesorhizobium sp.]|nr:MAG: hypothetical protein E5V28_14410 [Mesorhizobium sp.]
MNGEFQRMTRETSLSRKDHAQMRKCRRVQLDARRFSGQAMPGLLHFALQKLQKSTARSLERVKGCSAI